LYEKKDKLCKTLCVSHILERPVEKHVLQYSNFTGMAGVASGICFIALRDKDSQSLRIYPDHVTYQYGLSFILAWVGAGLCIVEGFLFLF